MLLLMKFVLPGLAGVAEFLHHVVMKMGGFGLMLVAFADSSLLSIAEGNDILIVVLSAGAAWKRMAYYVAMTMVGSVIGCLFLYSVGRKGGSALLRQKFSEKSVERAVRLYEKYGILAVAIPSILPPPCPFKIFVLGAGVFRVKAWKFVAAVVIGRLIRYSIWGIIAVLYGGAVIAAMQRNLPILGMGVIAFFLLIASAIAVCCMRRFHVGKIEQIGA
jgi:membrane protein YqaA with SNARE-associated domain